MHEQRGDGTPAEQPSEVDPTALAMAAATAGGALGTAGPQPDVLRPRPWSLEAAMEPLPPLAPPPARPSGTGSASNSDPAPRRGPGPRTAALSLVLLIVAALVILVLVLVVGR